MALTLIHNGTVITMGPQGVIDPGAVVIKGTRLVEVGPSSILFNKYQKEASRRIDATGKLVMPGLIDAHFHSCQQFMRGLFNEVARRGQYFYPGWKRILIPFESALSAEDVYLSGLAAYTNMVRVGTTFVSEHGGRHPRQLAKAMEQVGVRGLMTLSTMDMDTDQPPLPANMLFTTEEAIAKNLAMVEQWPFRGEGLVRGCFSLRQIIVCTPQLIQTIVGLAQDHDTMVQTHAAEGYYEVNHALREHGCRPTEYLDQIGGLSSRIIAAHSVLLSDREVELFAEHGVGVAHCPSGNFMMLGATKLPLMRRLGVPIGLGSDGAAGGSIDLLREMWVSYVGQITHYGAPKMDRSVTSPQQVLNMATLGGARVVGLADEIGSLEAGKRADLIVIDATGLDCLPVTDPYTTTVNCFSGHRSIDTVIINGQLVMQDGVILTVDEEELKQEVAERAKHLQQRFLASLH